MNVSFGVAERGLWVSEEGAGIFTPFWLVDNQAIPYILIAGICLKKKYGGLLGDESVFSTCYILCLRDTKVLVVLRLCLILQVQKNNILCGFFH